MDNRTLESGASATPPAAPATPSVGYPQKGNPSTGTPASKGGVFWYYQIGEELRNVLVAAGLTPSTGDLTQIVTAIKHLIDAQSGNYVIDTGAVNAYVVAIDPVITAYPNGMVVRFKAVHANTGASTLNAGGGVVGLVNDVGGALIAGDIPAGGIVAAVYDQPSNTFIVTSLVPSQAISQATADIRYLQRNTQDFRLTLTSATPVTTADITAATTLYFTPYKGTNVSIYSGSAWQPFTLAQLSIAVPAVANQMYDVFLDYNAGTPQLAVLAWTSDTARATALAYQDGVLVLSGTTTKRYLGSFHTIASGQTEDSVANRYVWNYNNRVARSMSRVDATASWTYTTAVFRQANGSTANQLNFIVGVAEDVVTARVAAISVNGTLAVQETSGIGLNSTTVNSAIFNTSFTNPSGGSNGFSIAEFAGVPVIGKNYLAWLEYSAASGTTMWTGSGSVQKSGIVGTIFG